MTSEDTIEGTAGQDFWFHWDVGNDVLYLVRADQRDVASHSEETADGMMIDRRISDDMPIGMTVISWWKRFGGGVNKNSLGDVTAKVDELIERFDLAA